MDSDGFISGCRLNNEVRVLIMFTLYRVNYMTLKRDRNVNNINMEIRLIQKDENTLFGLHLFETANGLMDLFLKTLYYGIYGYNQCSNMNGHQSRTEFFLSVVCLIASTIQIVVGSDLYDSILFLGIYRTHMPNTCSNLLLSNFQKGVVILSCFRSNHCFRFSTVSDCELYIRNEHPNLVLC